MIARGLVATLLAGSVGPLMMASAVSAAPVPSATFDTALTGAAVPGGGDPNGSGTAHIVADRKARTVCYTLSWANLAGNVTATHIHQAPAGQTGPPVIGLFNGASFAGTASTKGCVTATPAQIDGLISNPSNYYVNVHSTVYPNGAIRGQLG